MLARYTLADLAAQRTLTVSFDRQVRARLPCILTPRAQLTPTIRVRSGQTVCTDCRGIGAASPDDRVECPACEGRGGRMHTRVVGPGFVQRAVEVCRQCGGSGVHIRRPCATCGGPGLLVEVATLTVPLDGLVTDGAQMVRDPRHSALPRVEPAATRPAPALTRDARMERLHSQVVANKGHQTALDRPAGNVVVRFKEDGPHPTYGRHPDRPLDLLAQHSLTLLEALTGTTIELPRLAGGKPLTLHVPAVRAPTSRRKGVPSKG